MARTLLKPSEINGTPEAGAVEQKNVGFLREVAGSITQPIESLSNTLLSYGGGAVSHLVNKAVGAIPGVNLPTEDMTYKDWVEGNKKDITKNNQLSPTKLLTKRDVPIRDLSTAQGWKETGGDVIQTGLTVAGGGALKGATTGLRAVGMSSKLAPIVAGAGVGYAGDVGYDMSQGKSAGDIVTPGAGTIVGGGIPIVGALLRGLKTPVTRMLEKGANLEKGELGLVMASPENAKYVQQVMRNEGSSPIKVVDATRKLVNNLDNATQQRYGEVFNTILDTDVDEKALAGLQKKGFKLLADHGDDGMTKLGRDIGLEGTQVVDDMLNNVSKYGVVKQGKSLNFAQTLADPRERDALTTLAKEVGDTKSYNLKELDFLREKINSAFNETRSDKYNALVTAMHDAVGKRIAEIAPEQADNLAFYSERAGLIKEVRKIVDNKHAESKLANLFGKNKTELQNLLHAFEGETNSDIVHQLRLIKAGQNLAPILPVTAGRTGDVLRTLLITGVGGVAGGGLTSGGLTLLATSPRFVGEVATRLSQVAPQLQKASNSKAVEIIKNIIVQLSARNWGQEEDTPVEDAQPVLKRPIRTAPSIQ